MDPEAPREEGRVGQFGNEGSVHPGLDRGHRGELQLFLKDCFRLYYQYTSDVEMTEEERLLNGPIVNQPRPWLVTRPITDHIPRILDSSDSPGQLLGIINAFRIQRLMTAIPASSALNLYASALVLVRVEMLARGSPGDMAIIYALSGEDRQIWLRAHEQEQLFGRVGFVEPSALNGSTCILQQVSSSFS